MAVVTNDLVYRVGAVTGSLVYKYSVCDTEAEVAGIAGHKAGDIAFAKDTSAIYVSSGAGWVKYINANNPNFIGDVTVYKGSPTVQLTWPGITATARFAHDSTRTMLSYNMRVGDWAKDDLAVWGVMQLMGATRAVDIYAVAPNEAGLRNLFYVTLDGTLWTNTISVGGSLNAGLDITAARNLQVNGSATVSGNLTVSGGVLNAPAATISTAALSTTAWVRAVGGLYYGNDPVPIGTQEDIPYNSGWWWASTGAYTVGNVWAFSYSRIGQQITVYFDFDGTLSANPIDIYLLMPPQGTRALRTSYNKVTCWTTGGQMPANVRAQIYNNYFIFNRDDRGAWPNQVIRLSGSITYVYYVG